MSLAKSWFDHTFSSRQATEQLLRPDLESGLLSQHDFDLAVSFLPGYHRYLPYVHTVLWGAAAGVAMYRFKLKFRFPSTIIGVSAVSGYGVGILQYFRKHRDFSRQLDDRKAFLLVLENVNTRMGSHTRLFPQLDSRKMFEDIMKQKSENGELLAPDADLLGSTEAGLPPDSSSGMPPSRPSPATQVTEGTSVRPKSAWDAIREANAQNQGKRSSWDELRQRHERQRVPDRVPVQQTDTPPVEIEDPRAQAQAEFDAILEAERKAARG